MTVSLTKGQRISLEKVSPGLQAVFVGLGWDVRQTAGDAFDLDASVFMLGENEKIPSDQHFIFYNNLTSPDPERSVKHMGDNSTGFGDGDDEAIIVDLRKVPPEITRLIFTVTIHEAEKRRQNFGQVENAFVRLLNVQTKEEILRYDLMEDYSTETAMVIAEIYRKDTEWRLNAVGQGYAGGLQAMVDRYV
ncbi:MAG: TerD family protein [Spirulina sp. SIO3F2]|nr:TerD family protein [Spirulina sp. SIO3F2]